MNFSTFNLKFDGFNFKEKNILDTEFGKDILFERGMLLYTFAKIANAKVIVETGTSNGFSSICFAKAMKDNNIKGEIHTIDYYAWGNEYSSKEQANESIQMNDYQDIVNQHIGNSLEILPTVLSSLTKKVDLAHIDSEHDYDTPKAEFELIEPYLKDNAYVFFHDTDIKAVNDAVHDILSNREGLYEKIVVPLASEMIILRKISEQE